ncbi:MAG: tetratricopeptide repeat protein [Pyrinomonadaceae bacterium]
MSAKSSAFAVFLSLLVLVAAVEAQDKPELSRRSDDDNKVDKAAVFGSIRGRIMLPDGNYVNTNVKVTLQTLRDTINTIYTDSQGQFEFPDLIPGNYQIEVDPTDRGKFDPSSESVQVFKGLPSTVTLTLKPHEAPKRKAAAGTVSLAELGRNVPSKARKEFEKANEAARKGLIDEAIAHLRNAIAIAPTFVIAHNDLGVHFLSQGKLEQAAETLQRAVSLDATAFNPALNYGIVLVHMHRFAEGRDSLDKALKLQPNSAAARLYSGLAFQGLGSIEDAARELKAAYEAGKTEFAIALFHLGEIYFNEDRGLSRQYLENYLALVPDAANAEQVRRMIAILR